MQTQESQNRMIIDVRTAEEFAGGHAKGAINIPFALLPLKLEELKNNLAEITLCCASGARSRAAARLLHSHDIECHDAGPWHNVEAQNQGALQ